MGVSLMATESDSNFKTSGSRTQISIEEIENIQRPFNKEYSSTAANAL